MIGKTDSSSARHRGQALVELSLTIALLFGLIFGLIEVTRWFTALNAVQNAAREAARFASTGQIPAGCAGDPNLCRVAAIADLAYFRARTGLNMNPPILLENCGSGGACSLPSALIVSVRGSRCLQDTDECKPPANAEHPGVARGRVRITLRYNHPVINPFMSSWLPAIPVTGSYEIINEPWTGGGAAAPPNLPTPLGFPSLDSDGDGWPDEEERTVHGTSPATSDTDGDGVMEGVNKAEQTPYPRDDYPLDPCRPDSHSPTC